MTNTQAIIDAHHHYWDPSVNYHPWLIDEPMIPFRYGNYAAIRKPFLPPDYDDVAANFNIVTTVTMEGEWDDTDQVSESAWMSEIANTYGRPSAHVARTFLDRPAAADEIARHAAYPIVRGLRHKPSAASAPDKVEPGLAGAMSDPAWRTGYAELSKHGLHFELQAPWWHVNELLDLIAAFPETPVVINHAFMPVDRSREGLAQWREAIAHAAGAPGATVKISGIGIAGQPWKLENQRPIIDACIDAFGPERCMFASNFPVDRLVGSFAQIYDGFLTATNDLTKKERNAVFHDNAVRVYRLNNIQALSA